jgi:dihydrofolate reductase
VTADGSFATSDGKLDWVVPDEEITKGGAQNLKATDTILLGRKTYDMFEGFWPNAVADSGAASPHGGGQLSADQRAMGIWINDATKLVFSRTRKDVQWKNSRLVRELDPRQIEAMKREPGKDIMIFGSGSIVSQLTEHGLIDEYQFVVSPTLLGGGRSLICGVSKRVKLKLLEAKEYPSGSVVLRYVPAT